MRKHKGWKKVIIICIAISLFIPVLAACTREAPQSSDTVRTLRFASGSGYIGQNGSAFREFTELFEFEHKNIELEYIETMDQSYYYGMPTPNEERPDPLDALKEAMTGPTPPDIVMLEYHQLPELINENLLLSLDEMIQQEQDFNVDDYVPAVIEGLRKPGNGTLYALAPLFYSSAVIYNKQHFIDRGVEFPTDGMTWQEMFDLARRVTVNDENNPVYGFAFNNWYGGGIYELFYNMSLYTQPLGLKWIDEETLQMTANTPGWQEVWQTFADLYKEGVFPKEPDYSKPREGRFAWDVFLSGEAAMAVVSYSYLNEVITANNSAANIEGYEPIDWDVVSLPTHPEAPGVGSNITYYGIFAINANAENVEDAWEFIKFVTGEDWARVKSKANYYLVARQSYIQPFDGAEYNLNAFLNLTPPEYSNTEMILYEKLPDYWSVQNIGQMKFAEVVNNGKDIQQALQEWETEGQMMIQQMLENKDNPNGDFGILPIDIQIGIASGEIDPEDVLTDFEDVEFTEEEIIVDDMADDVIEEETAEQE